MLDLVGAVALAALGSLAAIDLLAEDAPRSTAFAVAAVTIGLGGTYTASSVIGFRRARRCERAIDAWKTSIAIKNAPR